MIIYKTLKKAYFVHPFDNGHRATFSRSSLGHTLKNDYASIDYVYIVDC